MKDRQPKRILKSVCRKEQGIAEPGNTCLQTLGTCESCPNWWKQRKESKVAKPDRQGKRGRGKFRVGQVVRLVDAPQGYTKLLQWDTRYSGWDAEHGFFAEQSMRPLTAREKGTNGTRKKKR